MPNLTKTFYDLTKNIKTNHYIETGTYMGNGIKSVLQNYNNIHSIELSEKWYNYNVEQFKMNVNVSMYLGDSKKILPELLNNYTSEMHQVVCWWIKYKRDLFNELMRQVNA